MTLTATLGKKSGNTIIPVTNYTKRTKQVDISAAVTSNPAYTSTNPTRAVAVFYMDSENRWRMRFNIGYGSIGSDTRTGATITVANVAFKNTSSFFQSCTVLALASSGANFPATAYVGTGNGSISIEHLSASTVGYSCSGDVELDAEPTTYTISANMENIAGVDIYIPPCAEGTEGVINNLSSNTLGNPIKGKTDGAPVAAGYVGEQKSTVVTSNTTINTSTEVEIASLLLTEGSWLVSCISYSDNAPTQTGHIAYLYIKGVAPTTPPLNVLSTAVAAGIDSSVSFGVQVVDVASGDADKTIKLKQKSRTANGVGRGIIRAIRIA